MILYLPLLSLLPFPLQFRLLPQLRLPLIPNFLSPALLYPWDWISEHQHTWSDPASRSSLQTPGKKKKKKECQVLMCLFSICWVDLHYAVFSRAELYLHIRLLWQLKRLSLTKNVSLKKAVLKISKSKQKFIYPWKMFPLQNAVL